MLQLTVRDGACLLISFVVTSKLLYRNISDVSYVTSVEKLDADKAFFKNFTGLFLVLPKRDSMSLV